MIRTVRTAVSAVTALLLVLVFGSATTSAQTTGAQTFTLQPGGKATITYEGYCTDFGLKFPTVLQAPNAVAEDSVRGALAYIQQNNLSADEAQALEAQYGIWQLRGAAGSPTGGTTTQAVVNAGSSPPATPQATSVLDAVTAGHVKLTLGSWAPIGAKVPIGNATDNFYGRGELTLENTSQQALTLYMPLGTLFPPNTAGEQTMAAYATTIQVSNPQTTNQSSQQPNQLPTTAEGQGGLSWLFLGVGLVMLIVGYGLRRAQT